MHLKSKEARLTRVFKITVYSEYSPLLVVNAGLIIALVYGIYYTILDRTAGVRYT